MLKVLIVEDEELIRKGILLTVDWAALDCMVVGEAEDGEAGRKAAERLKPSLIIADIRMPKLDGIEMLRQLRESGCEAYAIMLTAYDSFDYARSALKLGAVDFLLKPCHDGELEEAVQRLQMRIRAQKEQARQPSLLEFQKGDKSRYVAKAMIFVREHYAEPDLTLSRAADHLGISDGRLSHIFKQETGRTFLNYLTQYRIHRAMKLLEDCSVKVYEASEQVGYRDISYFSSIFKRVTGVSPSVYQDSCG